MKHLVITGPGKSLLGQWITFTLPASHLNDGQRIEQIKSIAKDHKNMLPLVFVTNDARANYANLDSDNFLIIKLTDQ